MKFSVLMSLYIKEQPLFLENCLASLKKQTYQADEIVLVFDGEITEQLETVVAQYQTQLPIKVVRLPQNVGLGKALNEGILHCSHEWIFRMDTDDICHEERFAKQVKFIENNPNIALFGGQLIEFKYDIKELASQRKVPTGAEEIRQFAKKRCPFNHMTVAYRKSMLLAVGGYQHHLFLEDYNLWLRIIAKNYPVANLPDVLVYMRVGNGMVNRRRGWVYFKSEWKLAKLKRELGYETTIGMLLHFLMRGVPRLLPTQMLGVIYKLLRK